jgi:hypothetical protein
VFLALEKDVTRRQTAYPGRVAAGGDPPAGSYVPFWPGSRTVNSRSTERPATLKA